MLQAIGVFLSRQNHRIVSNDFRIGLVILAKLFL